MPRIPSAQRRQHLKAAALAVISRNGIQAATTRAIVTEARMSLASFHYVFGSRDELLREVISDVIADYRGVELALELSEVDDPAHLLEEALRAYVGLVVTDPRREQGMLELSLYAIRHKTEMHDLSATQYRSYYEFVEHLLGQIAELGQIRWTQPVSTLARTIVALTDGLTIAYLATNDRSALDSQVGAIAHMLATQSLPDRP